MTEPHDVPFDDLYAYRTWVRSLARRLVRDDATADDLEQHVWSVAVERPPRAGGSVRAWLGAVARNAARNLRRAAGRRDVHETAAKRPESDGGASSPEVLVAEAEAQQALVRAVLALDEPYRTAVLLRHFRGMETAEIASAQGVPAETVRTRLKRAHAQLRESLDRRFGRRSAWAGAILVEGTRGPWGAPVPRSGSVGGSGTGSPAGAGAGGLAMAGTLVKVAAAVVVLAGIALWWGLRDDAPGATAPGPDPTDAMRAGTAAPARSARPRAGRADPAADGDAPGPVGAADGGPLPAPVDLSRVDRDLDLHGVVVDETGRPVPGARIGTFTFPWRDTGGLAIDHWFDEDAGPATRTAADGTFSLRLGRAESVEMRVAAPGFGRVAFRHRLAGERVRVVLRPAATLVVVAKDTAGAPLAGVPMRVFTTGGEPDPAVSERGTTDAEGRAVFDMLPPSVLVHIDAECPVANLGWVPCETPGKGSVTKELVFGGGRTLRGRITDAATAAPIDGASVGMNWVLDARVRTAADGTFELPGWTGRGMDDIHVLASGYERASAVVGTRETLDFALVRGISATGRVVGSDGRPAAGAIVSALGEGHGRSDALSAADTRTRPDGTFTLESLSRSLAHTVSVTAPGAAQWRTTFTPPAEGDAALGDIRLAPPHRVEGAVTDAASAPVPRAFVSFGPPGTDRWREAIEGRTDDLGRFRFRDVPSGEFEVCVRPEGASEVRVPVTVPAEGDVLDVAVRIAGGREIRVRVVRDDGTPVSGVPVAATDENGGTSRARTDAEGNAVLRAAGAVTVEALLWALEQASAPALAPGPVDVAAGETEVVFTLAAAEWITGTVLDPDGKPVAGAMVTFVDAEGGHASAVAASDGRFRLTVAKGDRGFVAFHGDTLSGSGMKWLPLQGRADVGESRSGVEIRAHAVRTGLSLRVRVVGADGNAVPGAMITLARSGVGEPSMARSGADGCAAFADLDERPLQIHIGPGPRGALRAPVEVVPAGQEVVVRLTPAAVVGGTVVRADGTAVRARIELHLGDDIQATTVSAAADGRFKFHLADDGRGPFRLRATELSADAPAPGVVAPAATADAVSPGTEDVRLVLPQP